MAKSLSGRKIVVVSPHSDDGVLSLGAAMASWARRGADVELLTVLALDPESVAAAGGWDSRAGFRTEGEAAVARREEDRRACAVLGVAPAWLAFGSVDYERHGDEDAVRAAVGQLLVGADLVLLPGSPLSHPDHRWLTHALVEPAPLGANLGLYAEQPYARRVPGTPQLPDWLAEALAPGRLEDVATGLRERLSKWRAIRRYASQLPLLGMERSPRRGAHVLAFGAEAVAWVGDPDL